MPGRRTQACLPVLHTRTWQGPSIGLVLCWQGLLHAGWHAQHQLSVQCLLHNKLFEAQGAVLVAALAPHHEAVVLSTVFLDGATLIGSCCRAPAMWRGGSTQRKEGGGAQRLSSVSEPKGSTAAKSEAALHTRQGPISQG